jgi:hypothetical protein
MTLQLDIRQIHAGPVHTGGDVMTCKSLSVNPAGIFFKWLPTLLMAVVLAIGAQSARAQMTGEFAGDLAIVSGALKAAIAATAEDDPEVARTSMEELYRQWRMLRAKNFEAKAANPLFIPEMQKVEDRLFAASKLVDKKEWAAAHNELLMAEKLLQAVRLREPENVKPIAGGSSSPPRSAIVF